ncbi:MAG TPA: SDR family oxidoreductase [Anaerolineaceae bacterium]|nr:SDR family oxidoreductase [Anaerolineaceae bacterium]
MTEQSQRDVLITGAAGGVGQAAVQLFSERGWRVIGVDRKEHPADFPADGLFLQTDIALPENIEMVFREASRFTSRLDALVNNAAYQLAKPLVETTAEEWDLVMASNLRPAFLSAKFGHALLKAAGGAIVNVSSVHAVATSTGIAAYAASKGGMLALTRAVAIEFAPDNIRVNAVLPGAVDTPMLRAGFNRGHLAAGSEEEQLAALARKTVNGRVAKPVEIATVIYFLADNTQSSFMTGQAVVVDGGATARLSTE